MESGSDSFGYLLVAYLLKLFFKLLYHQFAWTYDAVAYIVSVGRWKDWVHTTLPLLPGPVVLEIGHGPGHLQLMLGSKGLKVYGLDESFWMNQVALRKVKNTKTPTNLLNGYAQYLPFSNNSFNQIVATFPTEFIVDPKTLREAYRTLVPGGTLVVLPGARITDKKIADRLAAGLFKITHQAPEWQDKFLIPFINAGFQTEIRSLDVRGSTVIQILAHKSR